MNTAIVSGATGFIGSTLVNYLLNNKYKVIALGRKSFSDIKLSRLKPHENLIYIKIDMENISNLKNILDKNHKKFITKNSFFYHFAWGGDHSLSDLKVKSQLKNVIWTNEALNISEEIGIKKFIFVGTMEEEFTKKYLDLNYKEDSFYNRHVIYALAKLAARKTLKASFNKKNIKIIFATNSHVMGPKDDRDSFLQTTLKKVLLNEDLILAPCDQYFDVISSLDCARAYRLIGERGRSFENYWIGSGKPRILKEYVKIIAQMYSYKKSLNFSGLSINEIPLNKNDFSIENLKKDTGFNPSMTFEETVKLLQETTFAKL
ncbi:Hypothetical protein P9515_14131 [Prochlorococcus marinus str. MIT 9515]|uniref:NAD-dependent epimerase/dehydratase domain-containing protein n=1 Tax=Prochlorococcus marinus (strain MIT 9515) TaxID=167542 RepID=A2BXV9_PROM5|nr:NAD(P)-dependent oxidoreductase [Prochlorococcus marinus]ABM72620.1 Hypothetical protein P9515_14131 [Prochlorococcus marinus str. MIT 9515]